MKSTDEWLSKEVQSCLIDFGFTQAVWAFSQERFVHVIDRIEIIQARSNGTMLFIVTVKIPSICEMLTTAAVRTDSTFSTANSIAHGLKSKFSLVLT